MVDGYAVDHQTAFKVVEGSFERPQRRWVSISRAFAVAIAAFWLALCAPDVDTVRR